MSSDTSLDALEKDVVEARARVFARLERLKTPAPFNDARQELTSHAHSLKDNFVEQARGQALQRAGSILEDLKDRAAANPVAALAIGGGIAWHLLRNPPVTTLMVGAGVYALLRDGSPLHNPRYEPYAGDRPSSYVPGGVAGFGYPIAPAAPTPSLLERGRDIATNLNDRASEWASDASTRIVDVVSSATEEANRRLHDLRDDARAGTEGALQVVRERSRQARDVLSDPEQTDSLLVGMAALAIGGAVALSLSRKPRTSRAR